MDLQRVLKAIAGESRRFEGRLVLQLVEKASAGQFEALAAALKKVKGVRQVSQPDEAGVVLVSLTPEDKTLLPDLLKAARDAGVPVRDPARKKPPEFSTFLVTACPER
jgi:hypothetical protein